jgi:hypothetical protein
MVESDEAHRGELAGLLQITRHGHQTNTQCSSTPMSGAAPW